MKDLMHYKDYYGSVHFDDEALLFHGKVQFIRALVSYEGTDAQSLDFFRNSFFCFISSSFAFFESSCTICTLRFSKVSFLELEAKLLSFERSLLKKSFEDAVNDYLEIL